MGHRIADNTAGILTLHLPYLKNSSHKPSQKYGDWGVLFALVLWSGVMP